jgi:hypothetical protein
MRDRFACATAFGSENVRTVCGESPFGPRWIDQDTICPAAILSPLGGQQARPWRMWNLASNIDRQIAGELPLDLTGRASGTRATTRSGEELTAFFWTCMVMLPVFL